MQDHLFTSQDAFRVSRLPKPRQQEKGPCAAFITVEPQAAAAKAEKRGCQ